MSEPNRQNPNPEIATPHTSFILAKSIQAFASEVLEHTDERYLKELAEDNRVSFMITSDEDYCGRLEDWDSRFFSFAKLGITPEDEHPDAALPHCIIKINLSPQSYKYLTIPEGTITTLSFATSGSYVEQGGTFERQVAVRQEGSPMVRDTVLDQTKPNTGDSIRIDEWRELTESESQDLLFDIAELKTRLDDYLATHDEPLFAD